MSTCQSLRDIAQELSNAFSSLNVVHSENGPVIIGFDKIDVIFMALSDPKKFLIIAGLGDLPVNESDRLTFCERLLKANTCFLATGGFTLSHIDGTGVMLQGKVDYSELEKENGITKLVEHFLDVANYWKDQFNLKNANDLDRSLQDDIAALLNMGIRV